MADKRFNRGEDVPPPPPPPPAGNGGTVGTRERVDERTATNGAERTRVRDHHPDHDSDDALRREGRDARIRQRDEFGGINWGSAFFGWLVAVGLAAILTSLLSAAGAAIGLTDGGEARDNAETIGIVGGALLIAVLAIAYYAGGYVAGRMSRFDGARQGLATWLIGLIITVALAAAGAIASAKWNLLGNLDLPRIPIDEGSLTTGGAIALGAILLGTLVAAILGGKVGQRYHRKVDRVGDGR